jgi:hypothetical protein
LWYVWILVIETTAIAILTTLQNSGDRLE